MELLPADFESDFHRFAFRRICSHRPVKSIIYVALMCSVGLASNRTESHQISVQSVTKGVTRSRRTLDPLTLILGGEPLP
jgi:hypothetical protein